MSLWDDVGKEYGEDIAEIADVYVKASNILPYTIKEIKNVFSPDELEEVALFIRDMRSAGADNMRKAEIINKSVVVVQGLLRLGKFLV